MNIFFQMLFYISLAPADSKCDSMGSHKLHDNPVGEIQAIETLRMSGGLGLSESPGSIKEYEISMESNGQKVPVKAKKFNNHVFPSKGTVMYLCGGPSTCMDQRPDNVPADFEVVTFDYIGLGKNTLGPAQPELMSLESQAEATKTIIKALKLQNYLIYGQSFGTTVATVAAAGIGKDKGMTQPKSVILEGASTARKLFHHRGYQKTADRAWSFLSEQEKEKFRSAVVETRKKATPIQSSLLDVELTRSLWKGPKSVAQDIRSWLNKSVEERLRPIGANMQESKYNAYARMYKAAGCQAMSSKTLTAPMMLFDGLVRSPYGYGDSCDCRTIKRDYDPKDFQIRAPILYINGDMDPATPMDMVQYHMESQKLAPIKALVTVRDGGHFGTSLELFSCSSLLFEAGISGSLKGVHNSPRDFSGGCDKPKDSNFLSPTGAR